MEVCGSLGNRYHDSDGEVYLSGASKSGNRVLKWVVVEHFMHAVEQSKTDNKFKRQYEAMQKKGNGQDGGETACVPGAGVGGAGDLDQRGGVSGQTVTETQTLRTQA